MSNIEDLLPDPEGANYEKLKKENPYNILRKYAQIFEKKYPGKISGVITESTDAMNDRTIHYAFYILASIGNGYSYRFLEIEPETGYMYPLNIKIFQNYPSDFKKVSSAEEFDYALREILSLSFTQNLILNLLAQVDLYNDSRNKI